MNPQDDAVLLALKEIRDWMRWNTLLLGAIAVSVGVKLVAPNA